MTPTLICFGEILWDVLPTGKQAGGAPMNVAVHLRNFGLDAQLISRVGTDDLGRELIEFLEANSLPTTYVQTSHTHLTGVAKANITDRNEVIYKLLQPVAYDYIQFDDSLKALCRGAVLVYGSLAARSQTTRDTLLHLLDEASLKVFDVNLRTPHYTREVIEALMKKADILKVNHNELAEIVGWYSGETDEQEAMNLLRQRYALRAVCLTRGENGAALLDNTGYYESPGVSVQVEDTIGSGDAFLAAFLTMYLAGETPEHTLRYACAVGAYVATQRGATPIIPETIPGYKAITTNQSV
ncbi:carbohydrate kinase [Nibrella viscosa]|uniref:Carbohydrate kinase n=1 Tax=Nibrella viscosa TaxID=1084524 RepID=A0ABP8KR87_9BACT